MPKRIYVTRNDRNSWSWGETNGKPNVARAALSLRKLGISPMGIQQVISGNPVTSGEDREKIASVLLDIDMGGVMSG